MLVGIQINRPLRALVWRQQSPTLAEITMRIFALRVHIDGRNTTPPCCNKWAPHMIRAKAVCKGPGARRELRNGWRIQYAYQTV
mmetsp:Transcript_28810/g.61979  ORF Transcript_28810/g.61979 Transcript_28810/m.61979 type:complete len:84 (+) Transcript_28810:873-1124(+)